MLVTPQAQFDTIGGGHLEYRAIAIARSMLAAADLAADAISAASGLAPASPLTLLPRLERLPLGPSLGQCCGGVVHLLFEFAGTARLPHFVHIAGRWQAGQASWRMVGLDHPTLELLPDDPQRSADAPACQLLPGDDGARTVLDTIRPWPARLLLFGAGHVARHLVHALAHLPCHIDWVDVRADYFPAQVPDNVSLHYCDDPETLVQQAPAHASFLVMTHHHALDQSIVEAVLRRDAVLWLGLIGSGTKRAQFEQRLRQRGIDAQKLAQMVCPVGIPGLNSKLPAVIAASVCAQLLQVWQAAGQLPAT
jgi:xanthine dehydrogenase accessory factor